MQVLIFEISNIGLIIPQSICVVNKILAKKSPCKKFFIGSYNYCNNILRYEKISAENSADILIISKLFR